MDKGERPIADQPVVELEVISGGRKRFGFSMGRNDLPVAREDSDLFLLEVDPERQRRFLPIRNSAEDVPLETEGKMRFYHVVNQPCRCSLSFPRIKRDESEHEWDFSIEGRLEVVCGEELLAVVGETYAQPKTPLTVSLLASWLAEQIKPLVHDELAGHSITDLQHKEALPVEWWNANLTCWFERYGLRLRVDKRHWNSASAAAAEAEENRRRHFEQVKKQREEERETELQEMRARREYEEEKRRIETDATLSEIQRTYQLEQLDLTHKKEMERAAAEVDSIRRRRERESREHEVHMERLRQDADMLRHVQRCPHCERPLHNGETLDKILNLCGDCAEDYRLEERDREEIIPLRLLLAGPGTEATAFLFAKRTLQWGRSRSEQLSLKPYMADLPYDPGENDIILRVMEQDASGRAVANRERSLSISGAHGAITLQPGGKKEMVKVIDFSSTGGYLKRHRLPRGKWELCTDKSQITVGPQETAPVPGLGLSLRVFRDPENEKNVLAAKLERNDYLGTKHHWYVMVVREAGLGSGLDFPLSFPSNSGSKVSAWGRILVRNNGFMYEPGPEISFTVDGGEDNAPVSLEPGMILRYDTFSIEVNEAGERDFYDAG